jgi:hypothetical protein
MLSEEFLACVHGVDFRWLGVCHRGSSPAAAGCGAVSSSGAAPPTHLNPPLEDIHLAHELLLIKSVMLCCCAGLRWASWLTATSP